MTEQRAARSVEALFREERSRLLALLAARFGDLDLAEETVSDAIEAALTRWPVDGVPDKPLAWLLTTARRKAVDRIRRDRTLARRLAGPRWFGPDGVITGDDSAASYTATCATGRVTYRLDVNRGALSGDTAGLLHTIVTANARRDGCPPPPV